MYKINQPAELTKIEIKDLFDDNKCISLKSSVDVFFDEMHYYLKHFKVFHLIRQERYLKPDIHYNELISIYDNDKKRFKEKVIRKVDDEVPIQYRRICPYCGFGDPTDYDHILPKKRFSEYSFIPFNLVQVCVTCNRKKSNNYRNGMQRLFINPYLDNYLSLELFSVETKYKVGTLPPIAIELSIKTHPSMNKRDVDTLKTHVKKLKILYRLKDQMINDILKYTSLIKHMKDDGLGIKEVKESFEREYRSNLTVYGINYYSTLLCNSLRTSKFIEDYYNSI